MMNDQFEPLEDGEVISVQHDTQVLFGHRTFRAGELNDSIESHLKAAVANWNEANNGWFGAEGIECEALRFGSKGWQKGRIRLCLEFCPDEPNSPLHSVASSIPAPATTPTMAIGQPVSPPSSSPSSVSIRSNASSEHSTSEHDATAVADTNADTNRINTAPSSAINSFTTHDQVMPVVGIAIGAGVVGAGVIGAVAVATISAPVHPSTDIQPPITQLVDTTIEPADFRPESSVSNPEDFNEIAFDFDVNNSNGTMELDLTDLGLDFAEHDLLNFEANGMSDSSHEFLNLQDIGRPENSGMLIDEVWNEMNQGNWPGSN
jgi:hypothetical protein